MASVIKSQPLTEEQKFHLNFYSAFCLEDSLRISLKSSLKLALISYVFPRLLPALMGIKKWVCLL